MFSSLFTTRGGCKEEGSRSSGTGELGGLPTSDSGSKQSTIVSEAQLPFTTVTKRS